MKQNCLKDSFVDTLRVDFESATSPPGQVKKMLEKLFPDETSTKYLNIAAQLHQAVNNGTNSPLVFFSKSLMPTSKPFSEMVMEILRDVETLLSALSENELAFQHSPNEYRYVVANPSERIGGTRSHVGALSAHRRLEIATNLTSAKNKATFYVLCFLNHKVHGSHAENTLVFEMHSTPSWPNRERICPLFQPQVGPSNKFLFENVFHLGRPEYQLNHDPVQFQNHPVDRDSDSSDHDGSDCCDSNFIEESEVSLPWISDADIVFFFGRRIIGDACCVLTGL
jgi:hypothetical protein